MLLNSGKKAFSENLLVDKGMATSYTTRFAPHHHHQPGKQSFSGVTPKSTTKTTLVARKISPVHGMPSLLTSKQLMAQMRKKAKGPPSDQPLTGLASSDPLVALQEGNSGEMNVVAMAAPPRVKGKLVGAASSQNKMAGRNNHHNQHFKTHGPSVGLRN